MSTTYDRLPTLEEWVRAASLIVTGRVRSIKPLPRARIGEVEEEQAIAHMAVDNVLRGTPAGREIDVRFVSSRGNDTRAQAHPFGIKERLLLLLVPDVARDSRPNTYVAYLRGAFPLTATDAFTIQTAADTAKGAARKTRVTLSALRDVVRKVAAEERAGAGAWARLEPQLARRPTVPAVTELPDMEPGAGPTSAGPSVPATPRPARKRSRPARRK